jgi:hypothetical protein
MPHRFPTWLLVVCLFALALAATAGFGFHSGG